jgi:N4-gp56 family major capsid protein
VGLELRNGTSYYGNNHTADTFAAGDTLDACDIRQIVRMLELNKARTYSSGMFIGKTDPYSKYNLIADTTWVNAKTYSDIGDLYKGEMGELYQVKWLLNKDVLSGIGSTYTDEAASSAASLVTRFYTFVHGEESFGVYDLEKDQPKLYIVPNAVDSGSPAGRISLVSWAGSFATKLLNSDWAICARFASV